MIQKKLLASLKVGDWVVIGKGAYNDGVYVEKVIGLTKRTVRTTPNRKFSRESGDAWGFSGSFHCTWIQAKVLNTDIQHVEES